MPSFLSILETVSKANRVFTFANLAFDASMTGVQIAQAVDPNSVCVAWNVGGLTETAFAEGKKYDLLIDRLSNISTDMENIRQAIHNLQDISQSLENRWKNVDDIYKMLDEENRNLSLKVPSAQRWLTDLHSKGISSQDKIKELAKALEINAGDVAIPSALLGITIISMIGSAVYKKYYSTRDPLANIELLSNSLDPKWRLKEAGRATITTVFNIGSFAMNIYVVVKLADQCKSQADKLNEMIGTYINNTPTLDALINGCKNDQKKLKAVEEYLKKSSPDLSLGDKDFQQLLNDGLEVTLGSYNINVKGWLTDLEQAYEVIQSGFTPVSNEDIPGINQELVTKIISRYEDFKKQQFILNETDTTKKTTNERLDASREVVNIINDTISSATNHIIEQFQIALIDTKVQTFLISKATKIVQNPSKLAEFNMDKDAYVKEYEVLSDLDQVYPERTIFKDSDENINIKNIATYLGNAIENLLNPSPTTLDTATKVIVGNYECHLYDKGGKNDYHYVTISQINDSTLKWANRAGVSWTLTETSDKTKLDVGKDCPYFKDGYQQATVVWVSSHVTGILGPSDELYEKSAT